MVYPLLLPLPTPLPASPNLRFSPKSPKPGALSHKSTTGDERGMASWGRCAAAPEPHGLGWELVRSYDFVSWESLTHSTPSGLPWHWHTHQSSPVAGMPRQARARSPTPANTPRGHGELGGPKLMLRDHSSPIPSLVHVHLLQV